MTDMVLLRTLLASKKLSGGQEKAFGQMLQDMVDGKLVSLSKKQKEWAMQLYSTHNLQGKGIQPKAAPKPRQEFDAPPMVWDTPKPLKPPGKS